MLGCTVVNVATTSRRERQSEREQGGRSLCFRYDLGGELNPLARGGERVGGGLWIGGQVVGGFNNTE